MGNQGYPKLKGNASEGARWSEHVAKKGKYLTHRFPLAVLSLFLQNKSSFIFQYLFVPCGKCGSPYLGKAKQLQE